MVIGLDHGLDNDASDDTIKEDTQFKEDTIKEDVSTANELSTPRDRTRLGN